jgi:hypothetical protein
MSLNYLYELMIHFHTYKNIELLNQGVYQIKSKIYTTLNNKKYYALPYFYTESKDLENLYQTDEQSNKNPFAINAEISEKNNYEYTTKSFFIKYADEEIELDEFCYFRIEIPEQYAKNGFNFYCQFELYSSDLPSQSSGEQKSQKDLNNGILNFKFKNIQSEIVDITNKPIENFDVNDVFNESYSPIVYHSNYSSLLRVSIHKILIDYKIRMDINELPFLLEDQETKTEKKENTNDTKDNKDKNNNPISLINFILSEKEINNEINVTLINKLYKKFVFRLINSYIGVKNRLTFLTSKLIEENMKAEYSMFLNNQPLIIYSEETDEKIINLHNDEDLNDVLYSIQNLGERISDHSKDYIGYRIFKEINVISSQVIYIWHKYIELIRNFPAPVNFIMQLDFTKKLKDDLKKFLKKSTIKIPDSTSLVFPSEENIQSINNAKADEIRKTLKENYNKPVFENSNYKISPEIYPILFEETYTKNMNQNIETKKYIDNSVSTNYNDLKSKNNSASQTIEPKYDNNLGLHLIVLVHGFEGNSNDMRILTTEIGLINPSIVFLPSAANQEDTGADIIQMGKKLAAEVKSYIKEWNNGLIFKKISFIGHSIGGVIIRAALPNLEEFKDKFWFYLSLSSPHLGYVFSDSTLIKTGMWVLKRWKGSKSLEQFMQNDNKDLNETCLYKLSEYNGLNWFKYVYLLSSHQDNYSPYESSRIQFNSNSLSNDKKSENYKCMAFNILSKLTNNTLKRVDVNFVIQEKNFDTFIGRTAHIQFLENTDFMKIMFYNIEDLFK